MSFFRPYARWLDLTSGRIPEADVVTQRHLTDMRGFYADADAEAALIASNPLIYEVYCGAEFSVRAGELGFCATVMYPGKVGDEYYMSKGHFHAKPERPEIYVCLRGTGRLVMFTAEGDVDVQAMQPGTVAMIPPFWAHRTINTGVDDFAFLATFLTDAGHNYATIAEQGFPVLVVERDGQPTVIDNPRYQRDN